jgi:hypothetical protein
MAQWVGVELCQGSSNCGLHVVLGLQVNCARLVLNLSQRQTREVETILLELVQIWQTVDQYSSIPCCQCRYRLGVLARIRVICQCGNCEQHFSKTLVSVQA